ncbi:stage II sporulation protein P [Bacillus piscicola]|uniref:stage II sporulation protein P n=1 Tax=Bacillus piscicola TaxID=1632684 RepID=UPI001F09AF4E|nr:stage II sporulation protein P [Bacillus piscicola]
MPHKKRKQMSGQKRTSLKKIILAGLTGYLFIMFFITVITSVQQDHYFSSRQLHSWSTNVQKELLAAFFTYENRYFQTSVEVPKPNISSMLFEFVTRFNVQDPRTLFRSELPGFATFDGRIIVAGDGTDFTTMPIESAPPLEVLLEERKATTKRLEIADDDKSEGETSTDGAVAHIISTHSRESYLPELESTDVAFHPDVNVTLVGDRLGKKLKEYGIGTDVDKTDIEKKLHEAGKKFPASYDMSREVIQSAISNNDKLEMFFDIHRDSQPREITTVTINNETMARTMFVIGENNPHFEKNLAMAKEINQKLDDKYPGLSRGVITKGGAGSNGRYNQDLSEKSILIEMGGKDNTLEEVYRTADIMAEVISEYYWEGKAEPVKGDEKE